MESCLSTLRYGVRGTVMVPVLMKPIAFRKIDVRKLRAAGQEPFPVLRHQADSLGDGEGLEVSAPFLPSPLIEMLGSEGFLHSLEHEACGDWVVRFWRESASV